MKSRKKKKTDERETKPHRPVRLHQCTNISITEISEKQEEDKGAKTSQI